MTTTVNLRSSWDLSKSKYDDIDNLPLAKSPGPVLMIVALYLLFVLKLGPAFMRKRPAFKLTGTLFAYNAIQVVISLYLVQKVVFGIWLYFAAKVSELLDTVFFILRKKDSQVTFLHLYHHSIMVIGSWGFFKYSPSHTAVFIGFLNSLVHVFMYTYYGLSALGPNMSKYLTWKKYMTSFQLVSNDYVTHIIIFLQYFNQWKKYIINLFYLQAVNCKCPPSKGVAIFIISNVVFFLVLFTNFYRQCYIRKDLTKSDDVNGLTRSLRAAQNKKFAIVKQ
ncbi:hypothetical protein MSG28_007438 [Choristoneura fumiferana]|uniref:Uncharacterized protein n=1 Tax=Choristoneura fumiferana TaxID=7141 RepID=A0ACC0JX48_CHOFU|nr:hypothetical protein MSG28_007438 [Choristoneura fumiferana]